MAERTAHPRALARSGTLERVFSALYGALAAVTFAVCASDTRS